MKYFTLEWYHDTLVSQMCFSLSKSAKAAKYSDKFFESLYKKEKKWYVRYLKRTARIMKSPFSVAESEKTFDKNYQDNLSFVNTLPSEITSKIADMRVFALGTVEHSIADEITRYCGRVNRRCEQTTQDYEASLKPIADKLGHIKVEDLYLLNEAEISVIEKSGNDVIIYSDSNKFKLVLRNASCDVADNLKYAIIVAHELILEGDGLSFGILCENTDGKILEIAFSISDYEISTIN